MHSVYRFAIGYVCYRRYSVLQDYHFGDATRHRIGGLRRQKNVRAEDAISEREGFLCPARHKGDY